MNLAIEMPDTFTAEDMAAAAHHAETLRQFGAQGGLEEMEPAARGAMFATLAATLGAFVALAAELQRLVGSARAAMAVIADGVAAKPNATPWPDDVIAKTVAHAQLTAMMAARDGLEHQPPAERGVAIGELCSTITTLAYDHVTLAARAAAADEFMERAVRAEAELAALRPPAPAAPAKPKFTVIDGGNPPPGDPPEAA